MRLKTFRLADPAATLPMPDRGGRLFRAKGETIDIDSAFWAARIADREIIEILETSPAGRQPRSRKGK